jgi:AraC family ethanolamine operon transcriptional activator
VDHGFDMGEETADRLLRQLPRQYHERVENHRAFFQQTFWSVYPLSAIFRRSHGSMESRSTFTSVGELDQLREFARGAELDVVQLCPGRMRGVLAHCDLGRSSIHLNQLSLPARGRGVLSADRWTFVIFPLHVQGCFNSVPLSSDVLLAYPPECDFEGTVASGFHDWVFTVDLDELSQSYEALFHSDLRMHGRGFQSLRPVPTTTQELRTLASRALELSQQSPKLLEHPLARLHLHERLLEVLAASIQSASRRVGRPRPAQMSRWQVVRRAEDFMREHADQPISLTTLCNESRTSERSLRRAFHDVIGVSPMAYLSAIRMSRARAELEHASQKSRTVASIATRWEFAHLGRFARDYQRFFGELPSETLLSRAGKEVSQ